MRVLASVFSVVLLTGLIIAAPLLLLEVAPPEDEWTLMLAVIGVLLLGGGPLVLGSLLATWDVRRGAADRRLLRAWYLGVGLAEVLGAAGVVAYGVINGAPVWVPVLFIAVSAALTGVAVVVGPALLRREQADRAGVPSWTPVARREIRRKVMIVALVFGAVLIVTELALVAFVGFEDPAESLLVALALAFMGSALTCMIVSAPFNRALRESAGGDATLLKKLGKAVLGRRRVDLDPAERDAAMTFAQVMSINLPFQVAWMTLLYAGLMIQQITRLLDDGDVVSLVLLIGLAAILLVVLPLMLVRIARARRWVRAGDGVAGGPAGESGRAVPRGEPQP
jgi:hypothetical protein